jgi:hypothetical protein
MKNKKTKKLLAYKKGGGIVYSTLGLGNSEQGSTEGPPQTFEQRQREVEQRDMIRRLGEELKTVQKYAETERRRRELEEKRRAGNVERVEEARVAALAAEREAQRLREVVRTTQAQLLRVQQAREIAEGAARAACVGRERVARLRPLIISNYDYVNEHVEERLDIPSYILRELQDPITSNIMTDPVITTSGRTFDRTSINEYIAMLNEQGRKPSDPFSGGIEINPNILIPNLAVRSLIEKYFQTTTGGRRKLTKKKKSKKSRKYKRFRKL